MPATFIRADLPDQLGPDHFGRYVALAGDGDLCEALGAGLDTVLRGDAAALRKSWQFAYAPGKWTVAQVVQHVVDSERVFSYRLLRIARGDRTPLPGFDQDVFAQHDGCAGKSPADVLEEYSSTRRATLALVRSLGGDALQRMGTCSGIAISAGALGFAIVGHQCHHAAMLAERYRVAVLG